MADVLRSIVSFSWAMSVFGVRQMGNLIVEPDSATKALDSVTAIAQLRLDPSSKALFQAGDDLQRRMMNTIFGSGSSLRNGLEFDAGALTSHDSLGSVPKPRDADSNGEETIIRRSKGSATVRHGLDGIPFFIVHGQLVTVNGRADGEFEGVWSAESFTPQILVSYPEPPLAPFDRPFGPDEKSWNPRLNSTKAKWTFGGDRGWLEAVGPALSRIEIHTDGQTQFWYSVAGFVTGGGGVYDSVRGQVICLGSAHFAAPPQPLEALSFDLDTLHVLKIVSQH